MRRTPSRAQQNLSEDTVRELLLEPVELPGGEMAGITQDWVGLWFVTELAAAAYQEMESQFDRPTSEDLAAAMVRVFVSGYVSAKRGIDVGGANGNGTG